MNWFMKWFRVETKVGETCRRIKALRDFDYTAINRYAEKIRATR